MFTVLKDIFTSLLGIAVCIGMVWAILIISQLIALCILRIFGKKLNLSIKTLAIANLYFIPVLILATWIALVLAYIIGHYDIKIYLPDGITTLIASIIFVAMASIPCSIALYSILKKLCHLAPNFITKIFVALSVAIFILISYISIKLSNGVLNIEYSTMLIWCICGIIALYLIKILNKQK